MDGEKDNSDSSELQTLRRLSVFRNSNRFLSGRPSPRVPGKEDDSEGQAARNSAGSHIPNFQSRKLLLKLLQEHAIHTG